MIRFDKVSKSLSHRTILDEISFEVKRGETFVIVGPSGAGKSVTLKHMIALMRPDSGEVSVDGNVVNRLAGTDLAAVRQLFGVLFQSAALLEWLSIGENVALPLREKTRTSEEETMRLVHEKLALVGLDDDFDKHPSELSGGMRKRAGLARALIEQPEILLYDEPTSGLDPVSSRAIDKLIVDTQATLDVTSVVVTHDLHSALTIAGRIAMIYNGKMVEVSTPDDFIHSKNEHVRQFLDSQFITASGPWEKSI